MFRPIQTPADRPLPSADPNAVGFNANDRVADEKAAEYLMRRASMSAAERAAEAAPKDTGFRW